MYRLKAGKVVFDTNAYRNFTSRKNYNQIAEDTKRLIVLERDNNLVGIGSPIVLYELFSHLANQNDASFKSCYNSVISFYLHNYEGKKARTLADPEDLLCHSFFGKKLPSRQYPMNKVFDVAYHIGSDSQNFDFMANKPFFDNMQQHVRQTELNFSNQIKSQLPLIDPDSNGWQLFKNHESKRTKFLNYLNSEESSIDIGEATIRSVYLLLVGELEEIYDPLLDLRTLGKDFAKHFSPAIDLYKEVYRRLISSEFNLTEKSRTNYIWDYFIAQSLGQSLGNDKLYLITHDKAILNSAIKSGESYSILTLEKYLEYLKF